MGRLLNANVLTKDRATYYSIDTSFHWIESRARALGSYSTASEMQVFQAALSPLSSIGKTAYYEDVSIDRNHRHALSVPGSARVRVRTCSGTMWIY